MIKDLEGSVKHITEWIKDRAKEAHADALIVGMSGGVDSAVVGALCARIADYPTVAVLMPCHSSSHSIARAMEVVEAFKLLHFQVDLIKAFESITQQVDKLPKDTKAAHGALRSCLRAPTLDYLGKLYNGIIVGTGNRDEDEVTRYFQKRGDGCVDISPIAKLHKSEVYELAKYLSVPESIINATPSADLWGPDAGQVDEVQLGMTYQEVEWGIRLTEKFGGTRKYHFDKAAEFLGSQSELPERKKFVLETLGRMEEVSRHKENPALPVCDIRLTKFVE